MRAGFAPGSLMYGRELPIAERVATSWGTHTLVDAGGAWWQPWVLLPAVEPAMQ